MSCFACGIILSHYNYYNMAADARSAFGILSHTCSEAAESIVFFYVGITVIADRTIGSPSWDPLFILAALFCPVELLLVRTPFAKTPPTRYHITKIFLKLITEHQLK